MIYHGNPSAIQALGIMLGRDAEEISQIIRRSRARFETISEENNWNDEVYERHLGDFEMVFANVSPGLTQLEELATAIIAISQRYEIVG